MVGLGEEHGTGLFIILGRLAVLSILTSLLEKMTPQDESLRSVRLTGGLMAMLTLLEGLTDMVK